MVKNIGADIWPFIVMLNSVNLEDYDYLIKIHTKRFVKLRKARIPETQFRINGKKWSKYLLEFLEPKKFKKCIDSFTTNKSLGMVSSYPVIIKDNEKHYYDAAVCLKTRDLLKKFKYETKISYVGGTMFMARAKLFNIVKNMGYQESDFGEFKTGSNNQLPHVMERFLGCSVLGQGYEISDVFTPKFKIAIHEFLGKPSLNSKRKIGKIIKAIAKFFVKIKREKTKKTIVGVRILKVFWVYKKDR